MRFCDILDHNGDVIIPGTNGLVVRGRDKASVLVDESDSVDRTQVLIILLGNLPRVHVILHGRIQQSIFALTDESTYLNNLFI